MRAPGRQWMGAIVAIAAALGTGCEESAVVSLQIIAVKGGETNAAATIVAGDADDPSLAEIHPETATDPPSWLDEHTAVRMNGMPMVPRGPAGFELGLSGFALDTPVAFEIVDDARAVLVTAPVQAEALEVLGPPAGSKRSATSPLTVTFDRQVPTAVTVALVQEAAHATAFSAPLDSDGSQRTFSAELLGELREQGIARGAEDGPDGVRVELVVFQHIVTEEHETNGVSVTRCTVRGTFLTDQRTIFLGP